MYNTGHSFLKITLSAIFIVCGLFYSGCGASDIKDADKEIFREIELLSDAITIVQSDYVEEVEPKKLIYGAIDGLLTSLDGYSQFLDPESFKEMQISTKGEFGGLGIEIGIRDKVLTVIAPMHGTPAEKAGIKAGDRVIKIDGELTRDIKITEAVKRLRGKPKTKVVLTILRDGEERLMDFTVVRDIIKIDSITKAEMLTDSVGYIKLSEFQEDSPAEFEQNIMKLKKDGMKAFILDIRNNPGGLLEVACGVAEELLPEGKIVVSLKGRMPKQNKIYKAKGKTHFTDFPLVILVNEGSASASEIVAGAIQDNKRGIILGTKTFGKGSVQTVIPFKDGSAIKLTTAAYYTPNGKNINEEGIMPDITVALKEEGVKAEEKDIFEELGEEEKIQKEEKKEPEKEGSYDNQIKSAIDALKAVMICNKNGKM